MRIGGAYFIVGLALPVAYALASSGYLLPALAATLTGLLGVLVWMRLTEG